MASTDHVSIISKREKGGWTTRMTQKYSTDSTDSTDTWAAESLCDFTMTRNSEPSRIHGNFTKSHVFGPAGQVRYERNVDHVLRSWWSMIVATYRPRSFQYAQPKKPAIPNSQTRQFSKFALCSASASCASSETKWVAELKNTNSLHQWRRLSSPCVLLSVTHPTATASTKRGVEKRELVFQVCPVCISLSLPNNKNLYIQYLSPSMKRLVNLAGNIQTAVKSKLLRKLSMSKSCMKLVSKR